MHYTLVPCVLERLQFAHLSVVSAGMGQHVVMDDQTSRTHA